MLVLDDGTVAMLRVGQSSGYPDIDLRVEEMIRAVGRFPPLPQWIQGPSIRLGFPSHSPKGSKIEPAAACPWPESGVIDRAPA